MKGFARYALRALCALFGAGLLAVWAAMRYSPNAILAAHWRIFVRPGNAEAARAILPLWLLIAFTVVSCLALLFKRSVREAVRRLAADPRRLAWALGALGIWVLTMIPLEQARETPFLTDQ